VILVRSALTTRTSQAYPETIGTFGVPTTNAGGT
jgi:hypothetical protein